MCDREERDETGGDFPHSRFRAERLIKKQMAALVEPEPKRSAGEKLHDIAGLRARRRGSTAEHEQCACDHACRGTHVAAFTIEALRHSTAVRRV